MSETKFEEGPIHLNTTNEETGISTFTDYSPDKCRQSPTGEHDWSGEEIETYSGSCTTCKHCGLDFESFAMRCLP